MTSQGFFRIRRWRDCLWCRVALFIVLFAIIWAVAACADEACCPGQCDEPAAATALVSGDAGARTRAELQGTAHNGISAGAAVLIVSAFLVTVGTYRRAPRDPSSASHRCRDDGAEVPRGAAGALALLTVPAALLIGHATMIAPSLLI